MGDIVVLIIVDGVFRDFILIVSEIVVILLFIVDVL